MRSTARTLSQRVGQRAVAPPSMQGNRLIPTFEKGLGLLEDVDWQSQADAHQVEVSQAIIEAPGVLVEK
jgi:hypothetical protein